MKESNKVFVVRTTQEDRDSVEETEKKDLGTMSWMSWILRMLIKIHLVPVTWDGQTTTLDFHLWSKATFLACAITFVIVGGFLSYFVFSGLFSTFLSSEINFIDKAVLFVLPLSNTLIDIYSFLLAYGLSKVFYLALSKELPWPSEGPLLLIGLFLMVGVAIPSGTDVVNN